MVELKIYILFSTSSLHITTTLNHTKPGVADRFVNDIKTIAQKLMKTPGKKAEGKVNEVFLKK